MKLVIKLIISLLIVVLGLLIAIPIFLEKNIDTLIQRSAKASLQADLNYNSVDLSLIRNFPKAKLSINNLLLQPHGVFEKDTLLYAQNAHMNFSILELFKSLDSPNLEIDHMELQSGVVKILQNEKGNSYTITKPSTSPETKAKDTLPTNPFQLKLDYEIADFKIIYADSISNTYLKINKFYHTGKGEVSQNSTDLITTTDLNFKLLSMGGMEYIHNAPINLRATVEADFKKQKYTFKENLGSFYKVPIQFDGWVQLLDKAIETNLKISSKEADFSELISCLPRAYSSDFKGLETQGTYHFEGEARGKYTSNEIPKMDFSLKSYNGMLKYPDLPKKIENINMDIGIRNTTGNPNHTQILVNNFEIQIEKDVFTTNGRISNLLKNPTFNFLTKGIIDLGNLKAAYPIDSYDNFPSSGILNANLALDSDLNAIEKEIYESIKAEGALEISEFKIHPEQMPSPLLIKRAKIDFTPSAIQLKDFILNTGASNLEAVGTIENFIPFLLTESPLKGDFKLNSNHFKVADFLTVSNNETGTITSDSTKKEVSEEISIIPEFLDIKTTFNAHNVIYDDLELSKVSGILEIVNQKADFKNLNADFLGGQIGLNGLVSYQKETKPEFSVGLDLKKLDIIHSFEKIELLQKIAPITKALEGLFTAKVALKGELTSEAFPDLSTLEGSISAQINQAKIATKKMPLLEKLNNKTTAINLDQLGLKELTTHIELENGAVSVKPFDISLGKDIDLQIQGTHGLNMQMDYALILTAPASQLGNSFTNLLNKTKHIASLKQLEETPIQVPIQLHGSFNAPKVSMDLKSSLQALSKNIIDTQKSELKSIAEEKAQKVTEKAKEKLGDQLSKTINKTISKIKNKEVTGVLSQVLKDKETKDTLVSTSNERSNDQIKKSDTSSLKLSKPKEKLQEAVKNTPKDLLNGLFKGK